MIPSFPPVALRYYITGYHYQGQSPVFLLSLDSDIPEGSVGSVPNDIKEQFPVVVCDSQRDEGKSTLIELAGEPHDERLHSWRFCD